jgi:hypothetical protein
VAVEVEGGICWLWTLREGSVGCGKARDLAILFVCSQCSGSVNICYTLTDPHWNIEHFLKFLLVFDKIVRI